MRSAGMVSTLSWLLKRMPFTSRAERNMTHYEIALWVIRRCSQKKLLEVGPICTVRRGNTRFHALAKNDSERAIALKIVQVMNNIHAAGALIRGGLIYEWKALERIILEGIEIIVFLELGVHPGPWTKDHDEWLQSFYQSEYDSDGRHNITSIYDISANKIVRCQNEWDIGVGFLGEDLAHPG